MVGKSACGRPLRQFRCPFVQGFHGLFMLPVGIITPPPFVRQLPFCLLLLNGNPPVGGFLPGDILFQGGFVAFQLAGLTALVQRLLVPQSSLFIGQPLQSPCDGTLHGCQATHILFGSLTRCPSLLTGFSRAFHQQGSVRQDELLILGILLRQIPESLSGAAVRLDFRLDAVHVPDGLGHDAQFRVTHRRLGFPQNLIDHIRPDSLRPQLG